VYCYAPAILRESRPWGTFVEPKENIAQALREQLPKLKKGLVGVGTVTDPYQPAEAKHKLTRACLEILAEAGWPVSIQTKSDLVLRDLDLLKRMDAEVGFTITTTNDDFSKRFEPGASLPSQRLEALRKLSSSGVRTWVFIGPIIPEVTDCERIVKLAAVAGAKLVWADRLRLKNRNIPKEWRVPAEWFERQLAGVEKACKQAGVAFKRAF
jgi:DNA repair photolyase